MKQWSITIAALLMTPSLILADTKVLEGSDAKQQLKSKGDSAIVLVQKKKNFYLKSPSQKKLQRKPQEVRVNVGELVFITNEEKKVIHNVYDESDQSWVLTKQEPGGVAAVAFDKPGKHVLRCAIHPKMKTTVIVE